MAVQLSEYDLVSIGSHSRLDVCSVRPMAFDKGNMVLKPVTVMDHVSVCCHVRHSNTANLLPCARRSQPPAEGHTTGTELHQYNRVSPYPQRYPNASR